MNLKSIRYYGILNVNFILHEIKEIDTRMGDASKKFDNIETSDAKQKINRMFSQREIAGQKEYGN